MKCETSEINSEINRLLKQFKLPDMHDRYDDEVQTAVENNIGHREFLYKILKVEEQGKMDRLRIRNIKNAHFDSQKTIEEFDFNFPEYINKTEVIDLFTLSFMDKKENIIFIGPPGLGNYRKFLFMERNKLIWLCC